MADSMSGGVCVNQSEIENVAEVGERAVVEYEQEFAAIRQPLYRVQRAP